MSTDQAAPLMYDEMTTHVCSKCLGAIMRAGDLFRCAGCGHTGVGSAASVCSCGWRLPSDTGRTPARFACTANPARSRENPALFVIAMVAEAEINRPVYAVRP